MVAATIPPCRHCGRARVNRPRGLCWTCYYTDGVKGQYPSTSKYARRGVGNGDFAAGVPAGPTAAQPGTAEKVAVMAGRAERGECLWHPADPVIPSVLSAGWGAYYRVSLRCDEDATHLEADR